MDYWVFSNVSLFVSATSLTVLLWLLDLDSLRHAIIMQHSEPVSQTTHDLLQVRLTAH